MKKQKLLSYLFAAFIGTPLMLSAQSEPNNTISQASYFTFDYPIAGSITPNDVDYYKIEVPTFGSLSITLAGFTNDLDLQLLTLSGSVWQSSTKTGATLYESVNHGVPGGPNYYIVKVSAKNPATANTSYRLFGTFSSGAFTSTGFEPNETPQTAKVIYLNNNYKDNISSGTDVDWYQFTVYNSNTKVSVWLNNPNVDYDLELYHVGSGGGGPVASSSFYGNGNEFIQFQNTGQNTYRLRVSPKIPSAYNLSSYTLRIDEAYSAQARADDDLSIADLTSLSENGIYPNPVAGGDDEFVNLVLKSEKETVRILNTEGSILSTQEISNSPEHSKVNISGIKPGIYFIQTESEVHKLIIR